MGGSVRGKLFLSLGGTSPIRSNQGQLADNYGVNDFLTRPLTNLIHDRAKSRSFLWSHDFIHYCRIRRHFGREFALLTFLRSCEAPPAVFADTTQSKASYSAGSPIFSKTAFKMNDLIFVGTTVLFFILSALYVRFCERL